MGYYKKYYEWTWEEFDEFGDTYELNPLSRLEFVQYEKSAELLLIVYTVDPFDGDEFARDYVYINEDNKFQNKVPLKYQMELDKYIKTGGVIKQ